MKRGLSRSGYSSQLRQGTKDARYYAELAFGEARARYYCRAEHSDYIQVQFMRLAPVTFCVP
ncbi:hypothetical protein OE88DRAFT_1655184 [Heliocybe sulcata]|uniref:Uncharacterized protein n=1 Tax=Heliocybe sulcata TaxID=5364 RepID=A0A5C3NEM6_9AGAM|nr:hypothetical protein OE88DRAFT_1655184 [Heliocybe sulcata]